MEAILCEIMDRLQDIDDAMEKDNNDDTRDLFESLLDFVALEERIAKRAAWLKSAGVIS